MDFLQVIEKRKSVRKYADRPVEREVLDTIVKVAQTAPSSRNSKSSAFMIIEDKSVIEALAGMRDYGASPLKSAQAAIVVMGDSSKTDLWVDNCAISATSVVAKDAMSAKVQAGLRSWVAEWWILTSSRRPASTARSTAASPSVWA